MKTDCVRGAQTRLAARRCRGVFARLALLGAAGFATAGCADDSYLVVTLVSANETPFANVGLIAVDVTSLSDGKTKRLPYNSGMKPIGFDKDAGKTLSVSFSPSRSGEVSLTVTAFSASMNDCVLGQGMTTGSIVKGDVSTAKVALQHTGLCMQPDGGVPTDGPITFPGCDPIAPMCPLTGQTCYIDCTSRTGSCVSGGTKGPGEACSGNNDCMPGTQCFDYGTIPGCAAGTRVCLKFCASNSDCAVGAGGGQAGGPDGGMAGPVASACLNPVVCPSTSMSPREVTTTYSTCSFSCDPRGDATAGCPAGLRCFLFASPGTTEQLPDCGCSPPTRTKSEGTSCSASTECLPGHVCDTVMTVCRRLCRMDTPTDCRAAETCVALTNSTQFGVCR